LYFNYNYQPILDRYIENSSINKDQLKLFFNSLKTISDFEYAKGFLLYIKDDLDYKIVLSGNKENFTIILTLTASSIY
jgi:hypothetical protein